MKALEILNTILEDEEYEDMECVVCGFTKSYFEKAISELEALQQRIHSLESQLSSNPLQLTCESCEYKCIISYDCTGCRHNDSPIDYLDLECFPDF